MGVNKKQTNTQTKKNQTTKQKHLQGTKMDT